MSDDGWQKPETMTDAEWQNLEEWEKAELARTWGAEVPPQELAGPRPNLGLPAIILLAICIMVGVSFATVSGSLFVGWQGMLAALRDAFTSLLGLGLLGALIGVVVALIARRPLGGTMRVVLAVVLWIEVIRSAGLSLLLPFIKR